MKKTLLSLFAAFALGAAAHAQTIAIYEGVNSTTDISGTTVQVQTPSSIYEGYFFAKNISTNAIDVKIRRIQVVVPPTSVEDEICIGAIPDITGEGSCIPIAPGTVNWLSNLVVSLDQTNKGNMEVHINPHGYTGLIHYRYIVEDVNGTRLDSMDIRISNLATVKEVKSAVTFNAYPNPANDVINLSVQGTSGDNTVKLVDVLGNVVLEEKMGAAKKVDVSEFRNGVYILSVYSGGSLIQTRRIVVRH